MNPLAPINRLAAVFSKLPGVGKRSGLRMALRVARDPGGLVPDLVAALREVQEQVGACSRCGYLTVRDQDPCALCEDPGRDDTLLCVVEDPQDIILIEESGSFRGRYHALLGKLSPRKGEGLAKPRLEALFRRVGEGKVREVILALNTDVESDATAAYIHERLTESGVRVTRLAFGIPAGSAIAYSDSVTLARALQGRQVV
jgi:recombination protein RecR